MNEWLTDLRVRTPDVDEREDEIGVLSLRRLQHESQRWREHSFPPEHRTAELQALGVCEEAGELAHAILKSAQGIRGSDMDLRAAAGDAVGDTIIYLAGLCTSKGLDLEECVANAWKEVAERDWSKYKQDGIAHLPQDERSLE